MVINGNQWSSVAISGNQWPSVVITHLVRAHAEGAPLAQGLLSESAVERRLLVAILGAVCMAL